MSSDTAASILQTDGDWDGTGVLLYPFMMALFICKVQLKRVDLGTAGFGKAQEYDLRNEGQ